MVRPFFVAPLSTMLRDAMDDEPNPFESPRSVDFQPVLSHDYYVQPPYLVIKSGTKLPPRCIITNEEVSEDGFAKHNLTWTGKSFQLVIDATRGYVYWAESPWVKRCRRIGWIAGAIPTALLVALVLVNLVLNFPLWYLMIAYFLAAAMVAVATRSYTVQMPKVVNYVDGYFWMEGFGPEFLRDLPRLDEE